MCYMSRTTHFEVAKRNQTLTGESRFNKKIVSTSFENRTQYLEIGGKLGFVLVVFFRLQNLSVNKKSFAGKMLLKIEPNPTSTKSIYIPKIAFFSLENFNIYYSY